MITKANKKQIINKNKINKNDVGSAQVQIALLTSEIKDITKHLEKNKKDFNSKKNLLTKVKRRTKFLKYLRSKDEASYIKIKTELEIRR